MRALAAADDLAEGLRNAAAVVHLAGALRPRRPETYEDANLRTVERTVAALAGSSVERVVFLSHVGADRSSANAYLRTKAQAEELLYRAGRDVVILRCTCIFGPPAEPGPFVSGLLARQGRTVRVLGTGAQRIAPVYREDVVEAILTALDSSTYHGRFGLPGPEQLAIDDFARIVNRGDVRLRHVPEPVARALARIAPALTPELVDLLLADSLGDQVRADRAFRLSRRRVGEIYAGAGIGVA